MLVTVAKAVRGLRSVLSDGLGDRSKDLIGIRVIRALPNLRIAGMW